MALHRHPEDLQPDVRSETDTTPPWPTWTAPCCPNARRTADAPDHFYPLRLTELHEASRDQLIAALVDQGIASNVHFQPLPLLTAYRDRGFQTSIFRMPWALCGGNLPPLHLHMDLHDVDRVAKAVREVVADLQSPSA